MHICLTIRSLALGGAERVAGLLAGRWAAEGHRVSVITPDDGAADFFPLADKVERVALGLVGPRTVSDSPRAARRVVRALREALGARRPDMVISFMLKMNVITLMAASPLGIPVVISERTSPRWKFGLLWRALRRWYYPRAAALVVLTEEARAWAGRWLAPRNVHLIPNPVAAPEAPAPAPPRTRASGSTLIAAGRLTEVKGFDLLIEAFARSAERHPDWKLMILGEGPERMRLQQTAAARDLAARVLLPGPSRDVMEEMAEADLFALSSRMEGFPNALVEAMACGLPCAAFDCSSGPREIIRDGEDGLLVPPGDVGALAAALDRLMGDRDLRARLGAAARNSAARFSIEKVAAQWSALLAGIVGEPKED